MIADTIKLPERLGELGLQRVPSGFGQVDLWLGQLDRALSHLQVFDRILSVAERERAQRYRFDRHKQWFMARRGLLRILLGRYLDVPPQIVSFRYRQRGKPELEQVHPARGRLCFNDSHAEGIALYGLSWNRAIGADIERIKDLPERDEIVQRVFSSTEAREYQTLREDEKTAAFFRGWTRKEAYLKAIGEGLHFPMDQVVVSLASSGSHGLCRVEGRPDEPQRWHLLGLSPAPNHVAAVCISNLSGSYL